MTNRGTGVSVSATVLPYGQRGLAGGERKGIVCLPIWDQVRLWVLVMLLIVNEGPLG